MNTATFVNSTLDLIIHHSIAGIIAKGKMRAPTIQKEDTNAYK